MLCELCGKTAPFTKSVIVGGAKLEVCSECAKFGEDYKAPSEGSTGGNRTVIEQRLDKRQKRMGVKDVYANAKSVELVEDYGKVIREAREVTGMDLEEFANSINEKKGTIAKIETNKLIPDDKLTKKIEKALDIKLLQAVSLGMTQATAGGSGKMTLGDFFKK
ncbi:MAG TPA: multiprotein bridging factor aMBF1 [Candidatus Methanomethylophilaceae archaeon]|nr:multiprotein bridging factor aMBF1 [Candidatus Methanomethylophilaceae archaeon]